MEDLTPTQKDTLLAYLIGRYLMGKSNPHMISATLAKDANFQGTATFDADADAFILRR